MNKLINNLNPITDMFLIDNKEYDPFTDFFTTFSKALDTNHRTASFKDDGDVYTATVELPGYKKGEVNIEINDDVLKITAEKEGKNQYENRFSIKNDVDTNLINASLEYGVLTLVLPKKEVSKPRKIKVK
jgi:HSP20 family molecular chaperone IbpA|tara:strand:+ start:1977 stop:2366 length:390 start_codon:yes stop_codon:yes gene_type:complete